jgi:outer membrane protein OmpA-like peptidoglycan-associated protein
MTRPTVLMDMVRCHGTMLWVATLGVAISFGCSSKAKPPPVTPTSTGTSTSEAPKPAPKSVPASPNVSVSDDLAKQCRLRFTNVEQAPNFDYNATELLPADRDVLQQIADCLIRGPLKGKNVQLVGRADPRGTDEYNLGLGAKRAETIKTYLQRLGVPAARLAPTTRGELDAAGVDETGWERDRRVDLQLQG